MEDKTTPSTSSSLMSPTTSSTSSQSPYTKTNTETSKPIPGLFGSGLGYGLKAIFDNGEPDGSSGRADGVAVYLKRGAALILASVLGSKVFGGGNITTWDERTEAIKKLNKDLNKEIECTSVRQKLRTPLYVKTTDNNDIHPKSPSPGKKIVNVTPTGTPNRNVNNSARSNSFSTPGSTALVPPKSSISSPLHTTRSNHMEDTKLMKKKCSSVSSSLNSHLTSAATQYNKNATENEVISRKNYCKYYIYLYFIFILFLLIPFYLIQVL
jgi:hypothetical protein